MKHDDDDGDNGQHDKMQGKLNKFNNNQALLLDSIYHMTMVLDIQKN